MSARTRAPDSTKEMEELEAQATPKTQELEELEAPKEVEASHTRREGPHVQKEDRGLGSITLPEASFISNPAKILTKEETVGEGRKDAGMIKARKGLEEVIMRGNRLQATAAGVVPQGKVLPPDSGPSPSTLSQGGPEKEGDGCQDTWRAKA